MILANQYIYHISTNQRTGRNDYHEATKPKTKSVEACDAYSEVLTKKRSIVEFNIIGGRSTAEREFPHMAVLGYRREGKYSWDCGASLISSRFLLTAAHCYSQNVLPSKARLGMSKLDDNFANEFEIKNATVHHLYNISTKHHDIALVELAEVIIFSDRMQPACLYTNDDDPQGLTVSGWGLTKEGRTNNLQAARVDPAPLSYCNAIYTKKNLGVSPTQICAGGETQDACIGDSGGPLQIRGESGMYSVVGVISFGIGCGGRAPGVYTRVSKYLDWIEGIVWK
ncbi:hypothetical protein JTB14_021852 [Gonioctena quinquepunctata]|nr:hypothetical protein JTB14_021852 [Gonioctena quinquepunctata]